MKPDSFSTNPIKKELARKVLHLPVLFLPFLAQINLTLTLGFLACLIVAYGGLFLIKQKLGVRFFLLTRITEYCQRGDSFDISPIWLAMGIMASLWLDRPDFTYFAVYCLAVPDSAAALVGRKYGSHRIGQFSKSWEGSGAFFITCLLGALFYFGLSHALFVALALTVVELLCVRGLDNLILPIAAQLFLNYFSLIR